MVGEWGFAAVFGDDEGVGGEDDSAASAAKEMQGVGVFGFGFPGGIEVDEVEEIGGAGFGGGFLRSLGGTFEQGAGSAFFDGVGVRDLQGLEVGADGSEGGFGLLGEEDLHGSAAESLDADGSGAGVEVGEAAVGDAGREDVEEGLAQAVAGGPGSSSARGDQLAGAVGSGDNAHPFIMNARPPKTDHASTRMITDQKQFVLQIRSPR